jgi:SAM-dependent methyltransferase
MDKVRYRSHNWLAIKNNNKWVRDSLPFLKGRVIDLGCGNAPYKEDITKHTDQYTGVDWPHSYHDRRDIDVYANLVEGLPFQDEHADTVTALKVLEHLSEPDYFLSECKRILRPRGRLFILVPFVWQIHEAPHDYFRYTKYGLEYLLEKHGFVDIQIREKTGFWEMWILKFNYHTLKFAVHRPLRLFWIPVWWLGQTAAPILDKYDKHPEMTGSYAVFARRGP